MRVSSGLGPARTSQARRLEERETGRGGDEGEERGASYLVALDVQPGTRLHGPQQTMYFAEAGAWTGQGLRGGREGDVEPG